VNTSDIASKQISVQDTVGSADRHHSVFDWLRIKAPSAVQRSAAITNGDGIATVMIR
jgi:hypothetical protein